MAAEEREIASLRRLGLTEYESRVYVALVKMGPLKASEVGFFGQVPRTKTYGPMKELERKGLIHTMPGKPGLYVPSSPSEVLTPLVTKLSHEVTESEKVVQELALTYESSRITKRDIPTESGEFWRIDGRGNVFKKLSEILDLATVSINYSTDTVGLIRAYNRHSDALERASKKGAVVRMLSPISSENNSVAQEFSAILQLRKLKTTLVSSVSVDKQHLAVFECIPNDLKTDRGSDQAIWTTNKLTIQLHDQLFDSMWNTASVV